MKKLSYIMTRLTALAVLMFCVHLMGSQAFAENISKDNWDTFELMPIRIISVKGDAAKFRALNWMDDGTTGGVKAMGFEDELGKIGKVSFEGSAIPGDNSWDTMLKFVGTGGGYMTLSYGNFRKFFEVYGGYYPNFPGTSAIQKMRVDPEMDIGNFFFEIGSNSNIVETLPGASLSFERRTKEGIKSIQEWGAVTSGVTRYIAPAWQEESLTMDTITLKGNTDVGGFNISGEQRGELLSGRVQKISVDNATNSTSTELEPQGTNVVSSLKADKWVVDDKTYVSAAYRFAHSHSDMNQEVREFVTATGATNSDSHNGFIDGKASRDVHSWVQHFSHQLMPDLNFNVKMKQELIGASGVGNRERGVGGSNLAVESESQETILGESISLRYSGIPKTSLYTDWDFKQVRHWEWRSDIGNSGQFEFLNTGPETTGVIGARYVPNRKINITSQYRFRQDRDNFDVFENTEDGMVISRFNRTAHESKTTLKWKPTKWLQNSIRVLFGDTVYHVRNLGNFTTRPDWHQSHMNSQTYAYNAVLQPWDEWLFDFGYSLNNFKVSTPASQYAAVAGGIETFDANVHQMLMTASYAPTQSLSVFGSGQYTIANNYEDHSFGGLPLEVDNKHYDVSMGMEWTPKEDITIKPRYAYYSYRANKSIDFSNYSAHAGWVDVSYNW